MKKLISVILLLAVLVSLCACAKKEEAAADVAATLDPQSPEAMYGHIDQTQPMGGVYKLWNADGIQVLLDHPDASFELLCHIDLQGATIAPIDAFTGVLTGQNCTIKNFKSTWSWKHLVKRKECWLFMFFGGAGLLATTGSAISGRPFWLELGYADSGYLIFLQFSSLACILGSLLTGAIDAKWGPRASALFYAIVAAFSFGAAPLMKLLGMNVPSWFVLATMLTASAMLGATSNLIPSLIASSFGRMDFAEVFRKIYMGCFLLRSFCYLAVGPGVKALGSYGNVRLFFGCLFVVCAICVAFTSDKKVIPAPAAE